MFLRPTPYTVLAGAIAIFLGSGVSASQAAPVVIDDFNRATGWFDYQVGPTSVATPGKNWVEVENDSDDVAIIRYPSPNFGVLQLRDYRSGLPDAQATLYGIAIPAELVNITIGYEYLGHATDENDLLHVEWKRSTDSVWQTANIHELSSSDFTDASFSLPDDVTSIDLRFWTDVTDTVVVQEKDKKVCVRYSHHRCSEYKWTYKDVEKPASRDQTAKIDNIYFNGELPPEEAPDPTPIPGALPLFMSGAAVFGGLVYRRKRKPQSAA